MLFMKFASRYSLFFGFALIMFLQACSTSRMVPVIQGARVVNPNSVNIPTFKEKGDGGLSAKFSTSTTDKTNVDRNVSIPSEKPISAIELQGSWAISDRLGLMINYAGSGRSDNASQFAEFGLGYWTAPKSGPRGDVYMSSSIFGGYGYGSRYAEISLRTDEITSDLEGFILPSVVANNTPISSDKLGSFEGNFHRLFIQSSLVWSYKKSFDWGIAARLAQYYYPDFKQEFLGYKNNSALALTTIEPVFFFSVGSENVKLSAQAQYQAIISKNRNYSEASNIQPGNFGPSLSSFSIGVTRFFGRKK